MVLMSTFSTFNNFVYVWLARTRPPQFYTNVMATEVYIKGFIEGRLGYSSAVGIVMAAIMRRRCPWPSTRSSGSTPRSGAR